MFRKNRLEADKLEGIEVWGKWDIASNRTMDPETRPRDVENMRTTQ